MKATIEGLIFVCGDEGITKEELKKILQIEDEELNQHLSLLKEINEDSERGIALAEYGNILKFITKKEHAPIYQQLLKNECEQPLTSAALEVLAIIAYNQPITRLEVDEKRGVGSASLIRRLLLKELIYEAERSKAPGRPIIYRTTAKFLDSLGINSLDQLPKFTEHEEQAEFELFAINNENEENL